MFVDKKYPLTVKLMERMLDYQLEIGHGAVGNELTTAVQLVKFLKKQIADSKRAGVHDCFGQTGSYLHSVYRNQAVEMCLTSTDFPEQFQSGSVSGFGFSLLGYKIKQLVMNKMEQPTIPLSGKGRYLTSLYVSDQHFGLGVASEELCFYRRSSKHNAFPVDKDHDEKEE
ncbi:hypothetical protein Tco_0896389 [Tanacetum coccineum]